MYKTAYTLVELLIIVTITGVLITFGASAYSASARRQAIKSASETIISILQSAQKSAVIGEKDCTGALTGYRISYSDGDTQLALTDICSDGAGGENPGTTENISLNDKNKIVLIGSGNFLFRPLGEGIYIGGADSGTIQYSYLDTGDSYQFTIEKSGTIKYDGGI